MAHNGSKRLKMASKLHKMTSNGLKRFKTDKIEKRLKMPYNGSLWLKMT